MVLNEVLVLVLGVWLFGGLCFVVVDVFVGGSFVFVYSDYCGGVVVVIICLFEFGYLIVYYFVGFVDFFVVSECE